jgi:hypothetical protein
VDCGAEEGSPEETATPVGDHRPHSELDKEEAEDWKEEEGSLVMLASHLYRRKKRSRKDWI